MAAAERSGVLRLVGAAEARRALPQWLELSAFAAVPRPPRHSVPLAGA